MSIQDNMDNIRNMELLAYLSKQISGLKINFQKSEVVMVMHDDEKG